MMPWTRPLRSWQQRALLVTRVTGPDCLIMATPAAGKTTLALRVAHEQLERSQIERVVIVCPTDHLRAQWTTAAAAVGIQLDPDLHGGRCVEARDYIGAVVTYHQVARKPAAFAVGPGRRRTLVVLDEVHHAADGREWGDGLREAFGLASYRLALSGTPFRSDDTPIPFVRYNAAGISEADFTYGYRDAIRDQVCRPMFFPSYEGDVQWMDNKGHHRARFFDQLNEVQSRRRLKTALLRGTWLAPVLRDATTRLHTLRSGDHAQAGGLVIAMDQDHARAMQTLMKQVLGLTVPLAISDDAESSRIIQRFTASWEPWLIAVKMVSEGVDIPRLRVGIYATNISTEMYFRQVVGRFVRLRPELGRPQQAWLYLPKDPTLIAYAQAIEAERNHVLDDAEASEPVVEPHGLGRQASSFVPISATAKADELFGVQEQTEATVRETDWAQPGSERTATMTRSLAEHKEQLRAQHQTLVGECARRTGTGFREINLELIKRVGGRIEVATVAQLTRRIRLLTSWRDRGMV